MEPGESIKSSQILFESKKLLYNKFSLGYGFLDR